MAATPRSGLTLGALVAAFLLLACASEPVLISKSAAIPAGVDLSGDWVMRARPGRARLPGPGIEPIVIESRNPRRNSRRRAPRTEGDSAQMFLEFGDVLRISQTEFGLFISFDRSVVEEYTFGENRLISVGPIQARRVSGWDGVAFVVETLDREGSTLFETWRLEASNAVLTRDVRITKGDKQLFATREVFDRK